MKMQRFFILLLCFCLLSSSLSSCDEYNSKIYNHLSDAANYTTHDGRVLDIYYYDSAHAKISILSADNFREQDLVMQIQFDNIESVEAFLGGTPNPDILLSDYWFCLNITKENNRILFENGFYDAIVENALIELTASHYIYMDGEYFFVAAVTYNETAYLPFDIGFNNIKSYIQRHTSLL